MKWQKYHCALVNCSEEPVEWHYWSSKRLGQFDLQRSPCLYENWIHPARGDAILLKLIRVLCFKLWFFCIAISLLAVSRANCQIKYSVHCKKHVKSIIYSCRISIANNLPSFSSAKFVLRVAQPYKSQYSGTSSLNSSRTVHRPSEWFFPTLSFDILVTCTIPSIIAVLWCANFAVNSRHDIRDCKFSADFYALVC